MRMRVSLSFVCLMMLAAAPAQAQSAVRGSSDRATGENYRVEIGGYLWNPTPDIVIRSEALTQARLGSTIDFVEDLGIEKTRFRQIKVVLRPAKKHKFRFEYTPINYDQPNGDAAPRRSCSTARSSIVALPVATTLKWNAYRFGYEWDIDLPRPRLLRHPAGSEIHRRRRRRWRRTPSVYEEFARARAPIPAIGAIGRVYVVPNISITGEISGFKLPESIDEDYRAQYIDFDLYGTVNFTITSARRSATGPSTSSISSTTRTRGSSS